MRDISDILSEVNATISDACLKSGRRLDDVEIIAVTKTHGPDVVREAWDAGLRIVGERLPYLRSVSIGVWLGVGSMMELPGENGLSHFLEHMVFKGTEKRSTRQIAEEMDVAVADLSFISLRLVLSPVAALLKPEGEMVCLVKPQFEAGKDRVGKKGVVRDPAVHADVLREFLRYAPECGFGVRGLDFSPIRGPEGNIEYLAWLKRGAESIPEPDIDALVAASHAAHGKDSNK